MTKRLRILFALILLLAVSAAKASTLYYVVDNIRYAVNTDDNTAEVANYAGYKNMTEINIPASITVEGIAYRTTSLEDNCFKGCTSLASVTIPSSVTSLGGYCFYGCTSLTSVIIPNSVTRLASSCFAGCTSLKSISIPNSVTELGDGCFAGCTSLTSINIPESVKSLGDYILGRCSNLTQITVSENNEYFDSRENCNAIIRKSDNCLIVGCKTTVIPKSVTSLGDYCFYGCKDLTSFTIPTTITSLGYGCFIGCTGLTSINIPSSVTSIGNCLFKFASNISSITVSENNDTYDSRNNCNGIIRKSDNRMISGCKNTVIPNTVTSLEYGCFSGCDSLKSIIIPNSVTELGGDCFMFCENLKRITISESISSIGSQCFFLCSSLKDVTILALTPPVIDIFHPAFEDLSQKTLYVPDAAIEDYKKTYPWSNFGKILPLSASGIKSVSKSDVGMSVENGTLTLSNVPENERVSIYSTTGQLLGTGKGNISVDAQGAQMVIVKVGGKSYKMLEK